MSIIHPEDQEMLSNEWVRCNALGQPMDLVHRLKRFDGVYRWVHVRGEPLRDDRGRIVRWYYVFTDIDDQRRAEEALRDSEQHLRLLVETIPALVWRTTAEGKLDYVNRRIVDYIGQELGNGSGSGTSVHPDDRDGSLAESGVVPWKPANPGKTRFDSGAPTESIGGSTRDPSRYSIETVVWCVGIL